MVCSNKYLPRRNLYYVPLHLFPKPSTPSLSPISDMITPSYWTQKSRPSTNKLSPITQKPTYPHLEWGNSGKYYPSNPRLFINQVFLFIPGVYMGWMGSLIIIDGRWMLLSRRYLASKCFQVLRQYVKTGSIPFRTVSFGMGCANEFYIRCVA